MGRPQVDLLLRLYQNTQGCRLSTIIEHALDMLGEVFGLKSESRYLPYKHFMNPFVYYARSSTVSRAQSIISTPCDLTHRSAFNVVYKIPYRRVRAWPSARASKGILHTTFNDGTHGRSTRVRA